MKVVAVRDLCVCLGFCSLFFLKKKRVAVKPVEKLISGMGFAAYVSRDQQTFLFYDSHGKNRHYQ